MLKTPWGHIKQSDERQWVCAKAVLFKNKPEHGKLK